VLEAWCREQGAWCGERKVEWEVESGEQRSSELKTKEFQLPTLKTPSSLPLAPRL